MDTLSGLRIKRSRFHLSHRKIFDAGYYRLIPIMYYFALPGDVVTLGANIFVRSMPMLAPLMNKNEIDVRFFQVPLRLVDLNVEKTITGSQDGKVLSQVPSLLKYRLNGSAQGDILKYSFIDYLGIPTGQMSSQFPLSNYVPKAYARIYWDYYRDENLNDFSRFDDFESFYNNYRASGYFNKECFSTCLQKNYFTKALPWQLKGEIPTFAVSPTGYTEFLNIDKAFDGSGQANSYWNLGVNSYNVDGISQQSRLHLQHSSGDSHSPTMGDLNKTTGALANRLHVDSIEFNASQLRSMFAETRIMERLARCGSRYVEYLTSNFGIAPRDDTLQRAQYLGGFRQPLVFTEIPQTAQDADTPVGTLRGKGISSGGDISVKKHLVKEFSVIFGLLNIRTELLYTQGIDRTMCYSDRWDFFNPSLQNLSEQTIKNYEIYYSAGDTKNLEDFGFEPMYEELRKTRNIVCGDMRDKLSYWTQPIKFASRPNLTSSFIQGINYLDSFMSPFGFADTRNSKPFIIDCQNIIEAIRPISAFSIPGLIDHN